jgi:hypothetical protein
MEEIDRSWMIDGATVFYDAVFPPRAGDSYEGELDGPPFDISRNKTPHWVVRIKNMDSRYRKKYGVKVVSVADIKFIRQRSVHNE